MRFWPLALIVFCLTLSACGQKGPLYLPQDHGAPAANGEHDQSDDRRDQRAAPQSPS